MRLITPLIYVHEYRARRVTDIGRSCLLYERNKTTNSSEPFLFSLRGRQFLLKLEKTAAVRDGLRPRRVTFDDLPATVRSPSQPLRWPLLTAAAASDLFDIPASSRFMTILQATVSYRARCSVPRGDLLRGFKEHTEFHETGPFPPLFRLTRRAAGAAGQSRRFSRRAVIFCADAPERLTGQLRQVSGASGLFSPHTKKEPIAVSLYRMPRRIML